MAPCADDSKDQTVAEGFAGVALHRVEMTFPGKKWKTLCLQQQRLVLVGMCLVFCDVLGQDMDYFPLEFCMAGISLATYDLSREKENLS